MVVFAISFTFGVWLLQQQAALPHPVPAWLLAALVPALFLPQQLRWQRLLRGTLIALLAFGLGFHHAAWRAEQRLAVSLPEAWEGRDIEVEGVIAELPHRHERGWRFAFDVERALTPEAVVPPRIQLATYDDAGSPLTPHAGERWRFTVRLKRPHGNANPHGFDYEYRALEQNLRATGYVRAKGDNRRLDAYANGFGYRIERWREAVRERFVVAFPEAPQAGVLAALAIGDQHSIAPQQWQVFTRTGVNHLMSISGLHITMLSGLAFAVFYWLWRRNARLTLWLPARRAAAAAALLTALGYALLAGFAVPAQRTVYMLAAVTAALWLKRSFSPGQLLAFALLGVLFPDPWAILSPGFWLSFGAVALILFITTHRPRAHLDLPRWQRTLTEYGRVQWAMTVGLTPLLLGLFQQASLVSPVANTLAIPLVSLVVVPLTLLGAALPFDTPLHLAHLVMQGVMHFLEGLNALPQPVWTQHAPPAWSIVLALLGAAWLLLPRGFPARWLGAALMLPMFFTVPEPPAPGALRLIIFDVGQGLAVAAQTRDHALLYDAGPDFSGESDSGSRILVPTLRGQGIAKLDGMMLSHNDIDHVGGAASVLQAMPVGWLSSSLPPGHALPAQVADARRCEEGQSWEWDGVRFDVLHPAPSDYAIPKISDNALSCVLRITAGNHSVLLTGDIDKKTEMGLTRRHADLLTVNLLTAPHHGSKHSSGYDLVAATLPDYTVFSAGYRNRFGHPAREVLQRYADSGAEALRTDRDGALLVGMDAQGIRVERWREQARHYWQAR